MAYNQFRGRAMMMAGGLPQRGRGGMVIPRGGGMFNPMQAFRQPFVGQSPNRGMGYQGGNMQKSASSNTVKPAPIPPKPSTTSTPAKPSPATTPTKPTTTGSAAQTTPPSSNAKPTTPGSSADKAGQKSGQAGTTPAKPGQTPTSNTATSASATKPSQSPSSTTAKPGQSPASTPGKPAQSPANTGTSTKPGQSTSKPAQSPASNASKPAQSPATSKPAQTPSSQATRPSQSPVSQTPKPAQSPSLSAKQVQKPEQNHPASQQGKSGQNQNRPGQNQNQQKPGQNQQKQNQQQQKTGQQQQRPNQDQRQGGGGTQLQQQQKFGQNQAQQQGRPRPSNPQNQAGQKRPFSRFQDHPPTEQQQRQHEQYRQERREERQQAQQQVYMLYGGDEEEESEEPQEEQEEEPPQEGGIVVALSALRKPGEKTYTQRCRLFVGNLPADITEEEFKKLFQKYGEPGEVFINKSKGFGFIKLESRALSEIAKAELDDLPMRGRQLRVRFATHAAALSVKNLCPFVSNDLLEEAFSQFGPVERAIVIVDDRGRSTGKGIVEFASKPAARKAFDRCNDGVFLLTSTPQPVLVEPLEQFDEDDGLPEKLAQKHPLYMKEREHPPRFAQHGTFEYEYSKRWKALDDMEKQQRDQVEKNLKDAKEKLESEMDDAYHDHQANLMRQDLLRRQAELQRMEDFHTQEMMKRKDLQMRQEEERRRREEMIIRQRDMEEQMRRQREEAYRMSYMDPREREMRMAGGTMGAADPYSAANQQYAMPGQQAVGYEDSPGATPAASAATIDPDMRNERYAQGSASTGPASASAPRGMGAGTPNAGTAAASYSRGRDEYEGPNKKPRY